MSKRAKLFVDSPESCSTDTSTTINDLPCHILLEIFAYLDHEELLNTIPRVCDQWETLYSDPSLYRRFTFTDAEPTTDVVLKLLSMAPWLKSLHLINRTDATAILQCVGQTNNLLETLILRNCQGTPLRTSISSVSLLRVLHRCKLLQHLSLKESHCLSAEVYKEIGIRLPKLRSVDFGDARCFHSRALLNIADNCRQVEEIRAFAFHQDENSWEQITDTVVATIGTKLINNLRIIKLDFTFCTDASLHVLSQCKQITTLDLYVAHLITDRGIMAVSDMQHIVTLGLSLADLVSASGWETLFLTPMMKRLTKLALFMCENVDDNVARIIAKESRDLRVLRLVGNEKITQQVHAEVLEQLPEHCLYVYAIPLIDEDVVDEDVIGEDVGEDVVDEDE